MLATSILYRRIDHKQCFQRPKTAQTEATACLSGWPLHGGWSCTDNVRLVGQFTTQFDLPHRCLTDKLSKLVTGRLIALYRSFVEEGFVLLRYDATWCLRRSSVGASIQIISFEQLWTVHLSCHVTQSFRTEKTNILSVIFYRNQVKLTSNWNSNGATYVVYNRTLRYG